MELISRDPFKILKNLFVKKGVIDRTTRKVHTLEKWAEKDIIGRSPIEYVITLQFPKMRGENNGSEFWS
jgi:hypothetical protein